MKKITLLLIVFFSTQYLFCQTSRTINLTTAGTLKDNVTLSEQKTLTNITLSGNVDARDFAFMRDKIQLLSVLDLTSSNIKSYTGSDGTYSGTVTAYAANEIPAYAFYDPLLFTYKSTLTSLKLPSTATKIGTSAFYYSWNLAGTINIPASLTSIADYAFYGCSAIATFTVANSNTRYSALNGVLFNKNQDSLFVCPPAKSGSYTIPTTVKHIGASAFDNCKNLTSILIPNTITSIGSYAFSYCTGITGTLTLPTTLKKLGDGAFYGCSNLTSVTIPATLTDIGYYCFLESNAVTSFNVNASNPDYTSVSGMLMSKNQDTIFSCPPAKTGAITIPTTVKLIGSHAFYNCTKITGTITIPQYVDYIGYYAFYNCSLITSFAVNTLNTYFSAENGVLLSKSKDRLLVCPVSKTGVYQMPVTIKTIDPAAFAFCAGITGSLQIPSFVNSIGDYAFYNTKLLSAIDVDGANQRYSSDNGVLLNRNQDTVFVCPFAKTGSVVVPATVKHINYSAFDGCTGITAVTLPSSLQSIGAYAFEYCTGLTKILLPLHVTNIGDGAFYSCTNLTELSIANPQPPAVDYYTFDLVNKTTCKLIVPTGSATSYSAANYWKDFTLLSEQVFFSSISENQDRKINYSLTGNVLSLYSINPNDNLMIYTVMGVVLYNTNPISSNVQINLPAKGFYIIRSGNKVLKISI